MMGSKEDLKRTTAIEGSECSLVGTGWCLMHDKGSRRNDVLRTIREPFIIIVTLYHFIILWVSYCEAVHGGDPSLRCSS